MMPSQKTQCLLLLTVLLLLLIAHSASEVVQSMTVCKGFLLDNRPPQVPGIMVKGQIKGKNRYKVICQTYNNNRRFVTLYDTKNRIPVLSAYKFTRAERGRPENELWKMEPQLENKKNDKNMLDCDLDNYKHQASNHDYTKNKNYNRGHLFPSSFASETDDKIATFTLTNIVPQAVTFNSGSWEKMETYVKCILERFCGNANSHAGYVLTGAKPSPNNKLNSRVNIPLVLWSAFCCYSDRHKKWLAGAFWRKNVQDKPRPTYLQMRSLEKLHDELSDGRTRFEAFPGRNKNATKCPLSDTVEDYIPNIKSTCKYPPHHFISVTDEYEDY